MSMVISSNQDAEAAQADKLIERFVNELAILEASKVVTIPNSIHLPQIPHLEITSPRLASPPTTTRNQTPANLKPLNSNCLNAQIPEISNPSHATAITTPATSLAMAITAPAPSLATAITTLAPSLTTADQNNKDASEEVAAQVINCVLHSEDEHPELEIGHRTTKESRKAPYKTKQMLKKVTKRRSAGKGLLRTPIKQDTFAKTLLQYNRKKDKWVEDRNAWTQNTENAGRPFPTPAPKEPQRRRMRSGRKALAEIRYYQKAVGLIFPKAPFSRVVREICYDIGGPQFRWHGTALEALQEAAEAVLVGFFENAVLACSHAKRVTIKTVDMDLVRRIMRNVNVTYFDSDGKLDQVHHKAVYFKMDKQKE